MAEFIVLPKMTLTMEEGLLGEWYVKEGDVIKEDDPLCSVENEKETADVLSVYEGTILKLIGIEGEVYPANAPIAVVGEPDEDYSALLAAAEAKKAAKESGSTQVQMPVTRLQSDVINDSKVAMMPKVRKLVQQKGIDLDELAAFCGGRRITEAEVEAFEQSRSVPGPKVEIEEGDEVVAASAMRKTISKNMMESCRNTASLTNFIEADLTDAFALINKLKSEDKKVSLTAVIIKAAAFALREHKIVNTVYREDPGEIIYKNRVNIACAVDLPEGLAVPVILDADIKSVYEISDEVKEFAGKGRKGSITNEEMQHGTFTVSNVGMLDTLTFTPIINYPQTAILGVGTVRTLPRYTDDNFEVVKPRKIMQLAITYDHRIIDGAPASRFLQSIKALLQDPAVLFQAPEKLE